MMGTVIAHRRRPGHEPQLITLLELVRVISEITDDEREIVATVNEMLRSGRVKLCGNFRGAPVSDFC